MDSVVKEVAVGSRGDFELESEGVGALPIVKHFFSRIGLAGILDKYLPADDARLRLDPAVIIALVVANIVVSRRPLYALSEWAGAYGPGLLGLRSGQAAALNDDRVGRTLDRHRRADRASLVTETVLKVIEEFEIELDELHNDSTTVTLTGTYDHADGYTRGGKPTPALRQGHNKDFRPDLKQLLYILTISADGAVPIAYRTADGNTWTTAPTSRPSTSSSASSAHPRFSTSQTPSSAPRTRCVTSTRTVVALSPSFLTGAKRTPSSRTGSRPTCPPGRRRTADPVLASEIPTGCGGSSRRRFPPPTATG
jgi:hypothetical protein